MLTPTLATLLPHDWFVNLHEGVLIGIAVVAMYIVIKGADWLVEGAAGVAQLLGMPKVVIGATIVSLGTTSPEAAVSVLAAFSGNAGLALGNGVGSIIADTGLIFGMGLLLTQLPADKFILSRQGWVQFGSAALLAGICYVLFIVQGDAATITRWVGVLLVSLLIAYLAISVKWARAHPSGGPGHYTEGAEPTDARDLEGREHPALPGQSAEPHEIPGVWALVGMGLGGLLLVILAGDGLVQSVTICATRWGVPDVVIASTIVALGTSLPELVTGITAIRKGHPELLVGNVIGADILNVFFVVGLSALAAPLPIVDPAAALPTVFLVVQLPTMLIMLVLMRLYIFQAVRVGHFAKWMGYPLVALYLAYLVVSYAVSV